MTITGTITEIEKGINMYTVVMGDEDIYVENNKTINKVIKYSNSKTIIFTIEKGFVYLSTYLYTN